MAASPRQADSPSADPAVHALRGVSTAVEPSPRSTAVAPLEGTLPPPALPPGSALPPRPTLQREWLLLTISILVLVGIVAPPLVNLGRYQHRIIEAMGRSLGLPVTMRAVTLRLLPAPALVLSDVIVNEEPGFGAEPALYAPSVIAQLRLTSLWRGRLEVSRIEMSEASVNLVRNRDGHWNIGSVLLQASHVQNAPTAQKRPGPAPRFPYIEISDSRVNVKQGDEKLPYSLLNANLSMWLDEPDVWQLKLDAQPVRTDLALGLSDTGLLRVEGKLHRATAFGRMPLALHGDWSNAPLGQASRLLFGRDDGWRGDMHATADVSGELDQVALETHLAIANLHRQEFTPAELFAVDATCRGTYKRATQTFNDLACRWPVGAGQLLLSGALSRAATHDSSLELTADHLPASFLLAAASVARSDFAPAFRIEGGLSGSLYYSALAGKGPVYSGELEAPRLQLVSSDLNEPFVLTGARMTASAPGPSGVPTLVLTADPVDLRSDARSESQRDARREPRSETQREPQRARVPSLTNGDTRLGFGGPSLGANGVAGQGHAEVNAQLTGQGFLLHASGSASIARLLEIGQGTHLLPIALARLAPQGTAEFDVTHTAAWQEGEASTQAALAPSISPASVPAVPARGPAIPRAHAADPPSIPVTEAVTHGWTRLHGIKYTPPFLPEAVPIPAAQAIFSPGEITWSVPLAVFRHIPVQLSASYPLACSATRLCVTRFHASLATLDAGELTSALLGRGGADVHLLDEWLSRLNNRPTAWPALAGTVHADTFTVGGLALRQADAAISIDGVSAELESLRARALGGVLLASGSLKSEGRNARYELTTSITGASAAAAGSLLHENWGPGLMTLSTHLQLAGLTTAQLVSSAQGSFHAEWTRGGLGSGTPLARFARWTGDGAISRQRLTLGNSQLFEAGGAPQTVTGSIGFDRSLDLHISLDVSAESGADRSVTVTGTLSQPRL